MASTNGVIFPESMEDILANPVDICFGSMPATSALSVLSSDVVARVPSTRWLKRDEVKMK
jgi:hypothetical protein